MTRLFFPALSGRLGRAAALLTLAASLVPVGRAQTVRWELMPVLPYSSSQNTHAFDFLPAEGERANDPSADSLYALIAGGGVYLFNPSGNNGQINGPWKRLCGNAYCSDRQGLVTGAGTMIIGGLSSEVGRSTDRGRTWEFGIYNSFAQIHESTLPALIGPSGAGGLFMGESQIYTSYSLGDGARGTWVDGGHVVWYPEAWGDVPPSPALPDGRLVIGVDGGAYYTNDFGRSFVPSNRYRAGLWYGDSFTFLPIPGHPYGGALFAGFMNLARNIGEPMAEVHRSDDGGVTYRTVYTFTTAETGLPIRTPDLPPEGEEVSTVEVFATPDGALWAGVSKRTGPRPRGSIMRSVDQGVTWQRADAGFAGPDGLGYQVYLFRLARDGRLYAGTSYGIWRTTGVAVAAETPAPDPSRLGVAVRPNPARDRLTLTLTAAEAQTVRVVAVDVRGREVAVAFEGVVAGAREVAVSTAGWAGGVYVLRATAGGQSASARLTVAR